MDNNKIKSYCKINLTLRVLKKLKSGYHNIISLVTFVDLHDIQENIKRLQGQSDHPEFHFEGDQGQFGIIEPD